MTQPSGLVDYSKVVISEESLQKIRNLIYKETGMLFEINKNYYLAGRIKERMSALEMLEFQEYYHELIFGDRLGELKIFLENITINETYFFRDYPQLQGFANEVLPAYAKTKTVLNNFSINVWSAACSTGEEAYTLSIILQEVLDNDPRWKFRIDATDLDRTVLEKARAGQYGDRSMKDTPIAYRRKYFTQKDDYWQVLANASEKIKFKELNFMDRQEMRKMKGYDFIFCRNVLIYFDDESRKRVVSVLFDSLLPGGYLFLGHAESVGRITAAFSLERVGTFLCYRKPV